MTSRRLSVGADRLGRWMAGFAERHGPAEVTGVHWDSVAITARDGARVVLDVAYPADPILDDAPLRTDLTPEQAAAMIAENAAAPRDLAVVMVRRGGYAVAMLVQGAVTSSKVGSRYVQGRTAAGGWSQQRYARRRDDQTRALIAIATQTAIRLLTAPAAASAQALVTGGDRDLIEQLLEDPRLATVARLPRGPHLEVGDPRQPDIQALPARVRDVQLTLDEPDG